MVRSQRPPTTRTREKIQRQVECAFYHYQHWSVSHLLQRSSSAPGTPASLRRHRIEAPHGAPAAGSDSASYARWISMKSSAPRPAATSGWNRFAMDRYAALISAAVAVSRTLSTSCGLLAFLPAAAVATALGRIAAPPTLERQIRTPDIAMQHLLRSTDELTSKRAEARRIK